MTENFVIETHIDRVTVFTDRAQVTRIGKVHLTQGRTDLIVDGLPDDLIAESIRAGARANVATRLYATDLIAVFHKDPANARIAELHANLENLQDRDEEFNKRAEALTTRRAFLQKLADSAGQEIARGIALARTTVEAGASIASFLSEQFGMVDAEMQTISRDRRDLKKEIDVVKSELSRLHRSKTRSIRMTVGIEVSAESDVELEVSYHVGQASWQPLYDVRLSESELVLGLETTLPITESSVLSISYQAQVTQRTGEAWNNVGLMLSTAKPAVSSIPPELSTWYLDSKSRRLAEEDYLHDMTIRASTIPAPAAAMQPAALAEMVEAVHDVAEITDSGPSVSFQLDGRADIPADESPHKVTLAQHELPIKLDYVTTPKLVKQAYRRAKATNSSNAILLAGSASIFHNNDFIGSTRLKTVAPKQEFEIFLGVDDRITVDRKLTEGSVDKKFLQDIRRMTYAYEITITNHKNRNESITVIDQIPVSRHESIKIKRLDTQPKPTEESELGELKWDLVIAPAEEKKIRFSFTVESPRDMVLTGLPPLMEQERQ